jgi:uncharacterized phiE125 gp8 family phage protein
MRKVFTEPTVEPVTLEEAKTYLKVDSEDDDTLITGLIKAAREVAEHYTKRTLCSTTWQATFDSFSAIMYLYGSPVKAISSIKYYNTAGTLTTLASTVYNVDIVSDPARVFLASGQSWPATDLRLGGIVVEYTAGYTTVPETIKAAILLILGHLYENRQDAVQGSYNELPLGSQYLLDKYRVY